MKINIEEHSNGYLVSYCDNIKVYPGGVIGKTSVYKATDVLVMLEEVGRLVYGKKVQVIEK